jgi:hypothetical protein
MQRAARENHATAADLSAPSELAEVAERKQEKPEVAGEIAVRHGWGSKR